MNQVEIPELSRHLFSADLFRLVSNGFSFPTLENMIRIGEMAEEISNSEYCPESWKTLLHTLLQDFDQDVITQEFTRIFIKGGIAVNETHLTQQFNAVAEVNAYYAAFGFSPKSGESPDSIMYELEFAALLLTKWAIAPNPEAAAITAKAYRDFFAEHLQTFASKFSLTLLGGDASPFYMILGDILLELIQQESAFLKLKNI